MSNGNLIVENLYVSLNGRDRKWSGTIPEPNAGLSDGPFASIAGAQRAVRRLKESGRLPHRLTVWIRGGRYQISEPIVFGPEDSAPVTYAAYLGEEVIFDGGVRIDNWRIEEINGRTTWVAEVPQAAAGECYYRQLFINGQRRLRPRLPKEGYFRLEHLPDYLELDETERRHGLSTVQCKPGEIRKWRNLTDVDLVVLQNWVEIRLPIAAFDENTNTVHTSRRPHKRLTPDTGKGDGKYDYARYYVENVFEALTESGEWYLDRPTGTLYYIPVSGEEIVDIDAYVCCTEQLLRLEGDPENGKHVEFITFKDLIFEHAAWHQPPGGWWSDPQDDVASAPQANENLPGVIVLQGARSCAIQDCEVRHIGWYAIEMLPGCSGNRISGNHLSDLGAGGIILRGANLADPPSLRTGGNIITDNHIHAGGRVFHCGVGVMSTHSFGNNISHNHIDDLFYTGISCGFVWGYGDSISRHNRIEKNHIHNIGKGMLSDMGAIYTLGVQPGTVIRGNLIHDVQAAPGGYGGWAVYLDEGSAYMVVEENICYGLSSNAFHENYGRENIVRNNIFAFGGKAQIVLSRGEDHVAFSLFHNIIITDGMPFFAGGYEYTKAGRNIISDANLLWDVSGGEADHSPCTIYFKQEPGEVCSKEQWLALGHDRTSVVADPQCKDLAARDFTLDDASPALQLGFQPIDISDVGPRTPPGPKNKDSAP